MRKAVCLVCCSILFVHSYAQDVATCSDEDFRHVMDSLVSKGNLCYEVSDRDGINRMVDAIDSCLIWRSQCRKLTEMDSLEYTADRYKLQGSYHNENSYYDSASLAKAHEYYQKAMDIYRSNSAFNEDLQCETMIHRELAHLYYRQGNYQEAYSHTKAAYDAFEIAVGLQSIAEDDADYLAIQTQLAICRARMGETKAALAQMDKLIKSYKNSDAWYGEALRKKAKILMLQEESGGKAGRADALKCYKTYFGLKKTDALAHFMGMSSKKREQYWMRIRPFVTDCYRLEDADAGFLYDVTLFAKGLLLQLDSTGGGRQDIHATWQMIQKRLKPDACAIEFVQYEKYGQQQMGALVLKKTGTPVFVKMAQPDSVMQYVIGPKTVKERLYDVNGEKKNALYKDSTGFFRKIWHAPLLSAMGNAHKVYFAPDGYIHQIAIEYMLPVEASSIQAYRLSSTRSLLENKIDVSHDNALIIGGVNYFDTDKTAIEGNDAVAYDYLKGSHFKKLAASLAEVRRIIDCRHQAKDSLIVGEGATEQVFRQLCGDYPIIHLSTHGVFSAARIPQGTDLKTCMSDEALSQSVIALSGLQKNLDDRNFNSKIQDGALSAKELSSLDMSKVKLVVLACCETGLGYVTADGVYGIQRGLKNAGVKAVVCTLWDIGDDASSFFMSNFHRYIAAGHSIYQSFHEARNDMTDNSDSGKETVSFNPSTMAQVVEGGGNDFSEPCDKDAFILIDAIE